MKLSTPVRPIQLIRKHDMNDSEVNRLTERLDEIGYLQSSMVKQLKNVNTSRPEW